MTIALPPINQPMESRSPVPPQKTLILVGGGHSHALLLRMWGMNPLGGVRLVLLSDVSHAPYSGMLPGLVAGVYDYDQTHIDLRRLAHWVGGEFYHTRAIGLDLDRRQLHCEDRPPLGFDLLSLDVGSTPDLGEMAIAPEVQAWLTPAKPVPQFLAAWWDFLAQVQRNPEKTWRIAIIGGGAGGVELALNLRERLQPIAPQTEIILIHRRSHLLGGNWAPVWLQSQGIHLRLDQSVQTVTPHRLRLANGETVTCDWAIAVTQAQPAPWLRDSGLALDDRGFVAVADTLQSVSHPFVFAAGDGATMVQQPRPKSGVYAVRQARPLGENLRRYLLDQPLRSYRAQPRALALVGRGKAEAAALWGWFHLRHPRFWSWKDRIDRQFMARFQALPTMEGGVKTSLPPQTPIPPMYCAGCGAKVGATVLQRVWQRLNLPDSPEVVQGLGEDAAVLRVPSDRLLVQTIDDLPALVSDPFVFGQIATHHGLSDLYAMGAQPASVLANVTLPHGSPHIQEEWLFQLLSGMVKALGPIPLVGGHTKEGDRLSLGVVGQGWIAQGDLWRKNTLTPGQGLILTKPLGMGVLFAAPDRSRGRWLDEAITVMTQSNGPAAAILKHWGATACTDVTGFGLAGHLGEMLQGSGCRVHLDLEALPLLPGALVLSEKGVRSSLYDQNYAAAPPLDLDSQDRRFPLLFDPQTSGGLLASVNVEAIAPCVAQLRGMGYAAAAIGHLEWQG